MSSLSWIGKRLGEMGFNAGGGVINWFPGHMAAATRAIRDRLKLADLVIEVRDARIPLSSVNEDLQCALSGKRRVIALNKKDLANPNIMRRWIQHFDSCQQDCLLINAHNKSSVQKLLAHAELKLKEVISREPTLLVMVVGVPNVGKSTLINSIHQIAAARFPVQEKKKRATVGPLPGVTQDIAGYKTLPHRLLPYKAKHNGIAEENIKKERSKKVNSSGENKGRRMSLRESQAQRERTKESMIVTQKIQYGFSHI